MTARLAKPARDYATYRAEPRSWTAIRDELAGIDRGPPLSDTRDRIVDAARELFYEQGYESASLKQVAVAAGVHTGSIYHFFPTKAELVEAVLEHYLQLLDPVIMAPAREAAADPVERVMALLAGYRSHLLSTLFTRGCPIGALALELADSHPRARLPRSH